MHKHSKINHTQPYHKQPQPYILTTPPLLEKGCMHRLETTVLCLACGRPTTGLPQRRVIHHVGGTFTVQSSPLRTTYYAWGPADVASDTRRVRAPTSYAGAPHGVLTFRIRSRGEDEANPHRHETLL